MARCGTYGSARPPRRKSRAPIGGFIAGIASAMFELAFAWVTKGNPFLPLHMIAGIPLRRPPMAIDLGTALPVGMVAHMLYSMTAGVIVAFLLASVPWLRSSGAATIVFPGAE